MSWDHLHLCKGDHLLKECPGLSRVQEEWSKWYKPSVSSTSNHHVDNTPSTSDPLVKGRKGKVLYPSLICKAMHRTFLCPRIDETYKLLEYITIPQKWLPIGYRKLSLEGPLVEKVVDSVSFAVNPTIPLKSEVKVVNLDLSVVDPTLLLKSEVEVVESMSSPPDPTLSLESVKTEVVSLTKYSSCSSLPVENELKPAEVYMLRSDCS